MEFCVSHMAENLYTKEQIHRRAATHSKANPVMITTKVTVSRSDFCETMLLQIILFFHFIQNDLPRKRRISEQVPYYDVLSAFCRKEDCQKNLWSHKRRRELENRNE